MYIWEFLAAKAVQKLREERKKMLTMKKLARSILTLLLCLALLCSASAVAFAGEGDFSVSRLSVSVNGNAAEQRGFCWYTKSETSSVVKIFKNGIDVSASLAFSEPVCKEWKGSYMHKVTVSGLESGTEYTYTVGNDSVRSEAGSFRTDDGDSRLSFIAIADVQSSSRENFEVGAAVLKKALEQNKNADFVANLGDFTNDSTNEEWNLYDEVFAPLNRNYTIAPVAGNHDGLGVWHWFDNMFNLDTCESVQTLNGVNYSFDYGNAHFSVLNTNDLLSLSLSQLEWLKNDLASTDRDWKIVFMHKSPYTLGKDGKWPDALYLQQSLSKVLDEGNADIVFSGHDHMYLRTKKLTANSLNENGTTYVLSGTAGAKRYQIRPFLADSFLKTEFIDALSVQKDGYANYWNGTDWNSTRKENIGGCFNNISIDGGILTLDSYILADEKDENGNDVVTKIDSLTLEKETGLNTPTFDGENKTGGLDYAVKAVPSFLKLAYYSVVQWLPTFLKALPEILMSYFKDGTF